jgi:acetolactate synthase-1/2/3 large subunit
LIAVSGSRPSTLAGRQAFQDIDQVAMARPVVKWAAEVPDAAQIPSYLERAYAIADSGRKGAVHLTIPVDLFTAGAGGTGFPTWPTLDRPKGLSHLDRAIGLLRAAQRPVLIAGSGVWWARAEEALRRFIDLTQIPLYTITMGRGAVSDDHPLVMGYADPALNYAVHTAFREADLFLIVGKRIDYRLAMGGARLFPPEARFIQVDIHPQELGLNRQLDAAICADARLALEALADAAGPQPWPSGPWLERLRALRREWEATLAQAASDDASPMHPAALCRELSQALPRDVLYSWDGGDFVHWGRALARWEPSVPRCPTVWPCNWRIPGGPWPSSPATAPWAFTSPKWTPPCATNCPSSSSWVTTRAGAWNANCNPSLRAASPWPASCNRRPTTPS